ncbi:metallophosphoesterase family protein [Clostridium sp. OS1-26]|uniref:metallophosphoesterase family protein n=1 Tax=Clostridium sp. OS1-26 TaxID=3070681 RepID=UPI0027DFBE81|nr:metallophosphoesterase family protein [Clostridium sp. OS1-26]WML33811.1 metallophosphoesterase family protein [Clostridium sp. OS1-26]
MSKYKIGVISDTHGLLRHEALEILKGVDMIIHAGDVGDPAMLQKLKEIAPVVAVRGNCDKGEWAYKLKKTEVIRLGEALIYVIHNINDIDIDLEAAGFNIVISGHSHKPLSMKDNGILFLNPGSIGPRRFNLPISMGILNINKEKVNANLIELSENS